MLAPAPLAATAAPSASDAVAEIRKNELRSRRRRQFIIGGSAFLLLLLLIYAVLATVHTSSDSKAPSTPSGSITTSSKSIHLICTSTDYEKTCRQSLSKSIKADDPDPKELMKAAVSVLFAEVGAAFNKTQHVKTNDSRVKGAVEDCRELFAESKDELRSALNAIIDKGIDRLPDQAHDIKTWLSAVMSYQQTCVDGFPDGEMKARLNSGMRAARELTSNALAIIGKLASTISMLDGEGLLGRRRLLEAEDETEGTPEWARDGDRRVLQEGSDIRPKPNVTVAKDGSGKFNNISAALAAMPKKRTGRYVIHVKPGVYDETVTVTGSMKDVTIYGDDPATTIVTGKKNVVDGTRIFKTATFAAVGGGFMALRMTFRNTAGAAKHQAVALRVQSDRSIFINCHVEGHQGTLYVQTHRQFYRGCTISGTVDFVFGDAAAVLQNCVLVVRRPLDNQPNTVTAQGRTDRHESTGIVLHRCKIMPEASLKPVADKFKTYLGRPWKEHSRTVIMESEIGGLIRPEGYMRWQGDFGLKTLSYSEYKNYGPGADVKGRVKWPGVRVIGREQALGYTVANFLYAWDWIKGAGVPVPVRMGLYDS